MGEVYEAEHVRLGRLVAIKFLRSDYRGSRALARFRTEVRVLAALDSNHVVSVLDCGHLADNTPYLVMERLVGSDLRRVLAASKRLPVQRALRVAVDVCSGLSAVHAAGLVHRDLKPENLFLTRGADGKEHCKILDFGVAKAESSEPTLDGALIGTVRYMAPEQLADTRSVGPRTDVYAVGAILHECLTGSPAQSGQTAQEVMYSIMNRDVTPVHELGVVVDEEIEVAILRALARDSKDRFASAAELAATLGRFINQDTTESNGFDRTAADEDAGPRVPPRGRRRIAFVGLASVAMTASFASGWVLRPLHVQQAPQPASNVSVSPVHPIEASARSNENVQARIVGTPPPPMQPTRLPSTNDSGAPKKAATQGTAKAGPTNGLGAIPLDERNPYRE
jgi:serine/threonine-protein kinase